MNDSRSRLWRWTPADPGHPLRRGPLVAAIVVGVLAALLSLTTIGTAFEQQVGLWTLFNLRGPRDGAQEVAIIALRSDTGERISQPRSRSENDACADLRVDRMPESHRPLGDVPQRWGRCHFVELLRRLVSIRPSVVAIDVGFRPRDDIPPEEDRALGAAMRQLGNVVLAQKMRLRWLAGRIAVEDGPIELSRDIANAA